MVISNEILIITSLLILFKMKGLKGVCLSFNYVRKFMRGAEKFQLFSLA